MKRELEDMDAGLQTKTKELTVAYTNLANFHKKIKEEEKIRTEKEKLIMLEKQVEERIGA